MLHNVVLRLSKQQNEQFHTTSNKISKDVPNTVFSESNNTSCDKDNSNPVQTDLTSLSIKVDQLIETVERTEGLKFWAKRRQTGSPTSSYGLSSSEC